MAGRSDPDASADSTAHPTAAGWLMAVGKTRLGEEHFFCRTLAVEVVGRGDTGERGAHCKPTRLLGL